MKKFLLLITILATLSGCQLQSADTQEATYQAEFDQQVETFGLPGPSEPYLGPNSENLPVTDFPINQ